MNEWMTRMPCPKCGAPMNHHADKLVDPVDHTQAALADRALGGVIQQTHGCPACGHVEFRLDPHGAQPAR